ncbi:MAG: NAD(P)-dependent oxidoreductase, partial [Actinomycetota bacterium]|nr:NAD(P)-dependent oxidoreductase [Actinomycetota bacterium]
MPLLVAEGHEVAAMTRSPGKVDELVSSGAQPVVAEALDRDAVRAAVADAKPEVVVHQLTAIPPDADLRKFDREFELTNRLRSEGTDHLLEAARVAGARRFVAQSFAGWTYVREGGPVKSEEDPLDPNPPEVMRRALEAIRYLESQVIGAEQLEGLVLRYGFFYGPGTTISEGGAHWELVRRRRLPIVGTGSGVWSFIHIDDAASATLAAVTRGSHGIYNIVDDEPAPVAEWLPA